MPSKKLEVRIFEDYEAVETALSAFVEANTFQTESITELLQQGMEGLSDFTVRPLIELRTDGEEYWFSNATIDLYAEEEEEHLHPDLASLALDVVKYLKETEVEARGAKIIPIIYTVSERTYADEDDEEEESPDSVVIVEGEEQTYETQKGAALYSDQEPGDSWSLRPTKDLMQLPLDADPADLKTALLQYTQQTGQEEENQAAERPEPITSEPEKSEPEYDRGLTPSEAREFILFTRLHEKNLYSH